MTDRIFAPTFGNVFDNFGFNFEKAAKQHRNTYKKLAEEAVKLANSEDSHKFDAVIDKRQPLEDELKQTNKSLEDHETVSSVKGRTIRDWERGDTFPSQLQFKRLKKTFAELAPLSEEEEKKLDTAYRNSQAAANQSDPTLEFGRVLGSLIDERLDSGKINNHNDLAEWLREAGSPNEAQELTGRRSELQTQLSAIPLPKKKDYFLMDGNGEKRNLSNKDGFLDKSLNAEQMEMIERGIIPSPDLRDALMLSLTCLVGLNNEDREKLDTSYQKLLDANPAAKRAEAVETPVTETQAPVSVAVIPTETQPQGELAEVPADPAETPTIAATAAATAGTTPHLEESAAHVVAELPAEPEAQAPAPGSHAAAVRKIPYVRPAFLKRDNGAATKLATAYAAIFKHFGVEPPADAASAPKAIEELAAATGVSAQILEELQPFALSPISDVIENRLGNAVPAGERIIVNQLLSTYNRTMQETRLEISGSDVSKKLTEAYDGLKAVVKAEGKDIKSLASFNNVTLVPQHVADDYFQKGGLSLPNVRGAATILSIINQRMLSKNGRHNVFAVSSANWHPPVATYIQAHDAVRTLYEAKKESFLGELGNMAAIAKEEQESKVLAAEFADLLQKEKIAKANLGNPALQLTETQELHILELDDKQLADPTFAGFVNAATKDPAWAQKQNLRKDRHHASSNGVPGHGHP